MSGIVLRAFTVDTVKPKVTIQREGKTLRSTRRARATFFLDASEQVRRQCRVDSRPYKLCGRRYTTPRLASGAHRLKVKVADRAGNLSTSRKRFRIAKQHRRTTTSGGPTPRCRGLVPTILGTRDDDELIGTEERDVIVAFSGNDTIKARGGRDVICTRYGQDDVTAGPGADWVRGGPAPDQVHGGPGHDTLRGGTGLDACGDSAGDLRLHC
jgi:hypothetical protein